LAINADTLATGLDETNHTHHQDALEVQAYQTIYTGGKKVIFEVGDKDYVSMGHF